METLNWSSGYLYLIDNLNLTLRNRRKIYFRNVFPI